MAHFIKAFLVFLNMSLSLLLCARLCLSSLSRCLRTITEHFRSLVPLSPCLSTPPSQTEEGRWSAEAQRDKERAAFTHQGEGDSVIE